MKFYLSARQSGKTTAVLDWMKAAPDNEHRICVCHSEEEAMRLYRSTFDEDGNPTWAESWQFVSFQEIRAGRHGRTFAYRDGRPLVYQGDNRIVLAIDNLDMILGQMLRWPIELVTATTELKTDQ